MNISPVSQPGSLIRAIGILERHTWRFSSELELHSAIAERLTEHQIPFAQEVELGGGNRIDFLIAGDVGIEVKTQGSPAAVARQLIGYAQSGRLGWLLLASSRRALTRGLPDTVAGVPFSTVYLRGSL